MKVCGYVGCVLGVTSMILIIDAVQVPNNIDEQYFEQGVSENSKKSKRPFCNAFTGCGKKRSLNSDNSLEELDEGVEKFEIPVPIYRALLRVATREIQNSVDRELTANNVIPDSGIESGLAYLARKIQSRERYRS